MNELQVVGGQTEYTDRNGRAVFLRSAHLSDGEAIWRWRQDMNLDFMRATSSPTLEEHMAWMAAALKSPDRRLYILEETVVTIEGAPCRKSLGHLRLDVVGDGVGSVSSLLAPEARGRGLGVTALMSIEKPARDAGLRILIAEIHVGNSAALRASVAAGYTETDRIGDFAQIVRELYPQAIVSTENPEHPT
ncbi:MAG: hypothetical protein COZ43_05745 [Sphingomonadales bacterium CG_4_10_14_3_um_filter_58_15]|nr:MAG: hypothetical protein COZ43_05745 [Sphingomonadales bacterium CG_4_10_14_3_um_filter_58_15]